MEAKRTPWASFRRRESELPSPEGKGKPEPMPETDLCALCGQDLSALLTRKRQCEVCNLAVCGKCSSKARLRLTPEEKVDGATETGVKSSGTSLASKFNDLALEARSTFDKLTEANPEEQEVMACNICQKKYSSSDRYASDLPSPTPAKREPWMHREMLLQAMKSQEFEEKDPSELLRNATTVNFNNESLTDDAIRILALALRGNTGLVKLDLSFNQIGDRGAELLADVLEKHPSVKELYLDNNSISSDGVLALARMLKSNESLRTVTLGHNEIDERTADTLVKCVAHNSFITLIDVSHTDIPVTWQCTLKVVVQLNDASERKMDLRPLAKEGNALCEDQTALIGFKILNQLVAKTVETVIFNDNRLGDAGAYALAKALEINSTITSVELRRTGLTDKGAVHLAKMLELNKSLSLLDLSDNLLTDVAGVSLANSLVIYSKLQLKISKTDISVVWARLIEELVRMNDDEVSTVEFSLVGDPQVGLLAEKLKLNRYLKKVVFVCGVSEFGKAALSNALEWQLAERLGLLGRPPALYNKKPKIDQQPASSTDASPCDLSRAEARAQLRCPRNHRVVPAVRRFLCKVCQERPSTLFCKMCKHEVCRPCHPNPHKLCCPRNHRLVFSSCDMCSSKQGTTICEHCNWEVCDEDLEKLLVKAQEDYKKATSEQAMLEPDPRSSSKGIKVVDITIERQKLAKPEIAKCKKKLLSRSDPKKPPEASLLSYWIDMLNNKVRESENAKVGYDLKEVLRAVVRQHPQIFSRLQSPKNTYGVPYYESLSGPLRRVADCEGFFCTEFEIITYISKRNFVPEHKSASCYVFRAKWALANVVLKLIHSEESYLREIDQRMDLSKRYVLPIIKTSQEIGQIWGEDVSSFFGLTTHKYGIVLEAAEKTMMAVLLQEQPDFQKIRPMIQEITACIAHMHAQSKIHCDIKPLNIVRMSDKSWKLIDLDVSTFNGAKVIETTSSAFSPPEKKLQTDLRASPAFDIWSLGCVIFRALAHSSLLDADDRDNLRGEATENLSRWGYESITSRIFFELNTVMRQDGVILHDRLIACDLLSWMLQRYVGRRPVSCEQLLTHAFFNPEGILCMSWLHLFAAEGNVGEMTKLYTGKPLRWTQHPLGKTPLHVAAEEGNVDAVKALLLRPGIDVDARDDGKFTALQCVLHRLSKKHCDKQLIVCEQLCRESNLELLDGSNPPASSLIIGRESPNEKVRLLFQNYLVERLLYALRSRPPLPFSQDTFDRLCTQEVNKTKLIEAVFAMLDEWGFKQSVPTKDKHKEVMLKGSYVREQILVLAFWRSATEFARIKSLALQRSALILGQMCHIRDLMRNESPECRHMIDVFKGREEKVTAMPLDLPKALQNCAPPSGNFQIAVDEQVLVPLWRSIGTELLTHFKNKLCAVLGLTIDENSLTSHKGADRWVIVAPIKGQDRMMEKVHEYRGNATSTWPHISSLGDTLRSSVVCTTGLAVWRTWLELDEAFAISYNGRCKNNYRAGNTTRPPDMLLNIVLKEPGFMPMMAEIQIHHKEILTLKETDCHLLYEIERVKDSTGWAQKDEKTLQAPVKPPPAAPPAQQWPLGMTFTTLAEQQEEANLELQSGTPATSWHSEVGVRTRSESILATPASPVLVSLEQKTRSSSTTSSSRPAVIIHNVSLSLSPSMLRRPPPPPST